MSEPTLTTIVAFLRSQATEWDELLKYLGEAPTPDNQEYPAALRAAADRLEGLADLARAVDYDNGWVTIENVGLGGRLLGWLEARDRLLK